MSYSSAYKSYWLQYGIPVYNENTVPDNIPMPYITYQYAENGFDDGEVYLTVNLYYQGLSWLEAELKANEICIVAKNDGVVELSSSEKIVVKCDDGYIWIKRSSPFIQRVNDPNENVRHIVINVAVEFL